MNNTEISEMNIFQRMAGITAELKNGVVLTPVETFGTQKGFNAIREKDVLAAIRPLEEKYGVYSFPMARELNTSTASNLFIDFVKVVYRFVNIDKPDEYIDVESYGRGIDSYDKSPGKAMTYADKYALMKAYKICGNDAMDNDAAAPDTILDLPEEPEPVQSVDTSQSTFPHTPNQSQPVTYAKEKATETRRANPMMAAYNARNRTAIQSNPQSAQKAATEPPRQTQAATARTEQPADMGINQTAIANKPTIEEAKAFKLTIGDDEIKGKTLGEILAIDPKLVRWYATSPSFNANKSAYNRNLRACCLTLIEK